MANSLPVKHGMKGGLDRDTEYGEVREGNYTDAQNAQFISKGDNKSLAKVPYLGNKLAFDKGSVNSQNKKFRLYLTADAQPLPFQDFFTFNLFRTDKVTNIFNLVQGPLGTVGSYRSAISGALTAAGISNVITDGPDYIDIEITETPTYDYHIELSGIGNGNAGVDSAVRIIVTQESIAQNLTGVLYDIGSFDLNGDLFVFSTPMDLKPRSIDISSVFNSSGSVGVQTSAGHNLSSGDEIKITGTGICDGVWLVTVLNSVSFSLVNSTFTTGLSNQGSVVLNYTGVGEIGVMTYNETTDVYSYTRLIRSKELGFCREAQIDVDAEQNALGKSLYFNQYKYLPPRVFYYNGDYVTDGALDFVLPENRYSYGSIASEIKNILNIQTANLDLVSVNEGGAVKAGNKQYFIRLLGDEGSLFGTDFHAFTNNVNIYSAPLFGDPNLVVGNVSGTDTGKSVLLRASNLTSEVYSQIELCVAEWFGDAVTFSVIRREEITGDSMLIEHTGFETTRLLSAEEISRVVSEIENIGGQRIVDNRLVYHDINYKQEQDFTEWAKTFTHTIIKENVRGNGFVNDNRFGGYQDPDNVFRLMGYSWYEVHRFGIRVYFKDGGASKVFWVDDIIFNMETTNISTPNRRVGMSTTAIFPYDLNISAADDNYFTPAVEFNNIDWDFLIDGVRVKDLVGKIEFLRVELEDNTRDILFSGMAAIGVNGIYRESTVTGGISDSSFGLLNTGNSTAGNLRRSIYPFPFSPGQDRFSYQGFAPIPPGRFNTELTQGNVNSATLNTKYYNTAFIISNDIVFGKKTLNYISGDRLINYGRPLASSSFGTSNRNFIRDFRLVNMGNAFPVPSTPPPYKPFFHDIRNSFSLGSNSSFSAQAQDPSGNLVNATYYTYARSFANTTSLAPELGATYDFIPCVAVDIPIGLDQANNNLPNNPVANGVNTDEGLFYVSYQRPRAYADPDNSKFGDRDATVYDVVCGSYLVDENTPSLLNNLKIFGGDTFISRVQLKTWNNLSSTSSSGNYIDNTYALSFVSQSYVNPQMRLNDVNNTTQAAFPANPLNDYALWLSNHQLDQSDYDTSYDRQSFPRYASYVDNETTQNSFPTRIIWSDLKPEGSFFDLYRSFPALNFVDLNRSYGTVMHMEVLNDELFTIQHRSVQRQYFNTTGTLTSEPDELVVLGNAGVLGRKGMDLSAYGTRHKWSVVKGRTLSGKDAAYWYNSERGVFLKLSGNGIEPLSVTKGMFNFFNAASKFLFDVDTPALGFGICGGWNERFQELRMTFRGYKNVDEWRFGVPYSPGSIAKVTGEGFDIVDLYEATDFSRDEFPKESEKWVKIPHDNKDFYNEFSVVYSEAKDTFTTFLSPKPLIYMPWRKDIITQRYGVWGNGYPNFIENYGKFCVWYEVGSDSLIKDFYIEPVINYNSDVIKSFTAIYVNSDNPPDRVEFFTPGQQTFLVASDFEAREGMWVSEIKNDSTATGNVDSDTSQMYGRYIRVKLVYLPDKEEILRDVRIRLLFNSRYLQT